MALARAMSCSKWFNAVAGTGALPNFTNGATQTDRSLWEIVAQLLDRDCVRLVVVNAVLFLFVPDVAVSGGKDEAPQLYEVADVAPTDVIDDSLDQRRRGLARLRLGALLVREQFVVDLQEFEKVVLLNLPTHSLHGLFFRDDWHHRTSDVLFFTALTSASSIVASMQEEWTPARRASEG